MSIREKILHGRRSYFDMTPLEREQERERVREQDRKNMRKNILRALLPFAVFYITGTILTAAIIFYWR